MANRYYLSCYNSPGLVVTEAMKWDYSRNAEPKMFDTEAEAYKVAQKMDGVGFWPVVHVVRK